jgi:hypothetical protein
MLHGCSATASSCSGIWDKTRISGFHSLNRLTVWERGSLKIRFLFLLEIFFFMFSDRFDVLILKIIFKN